MIRIRKARKEDCSFIARMVMMALHITIEDNERLYCHMVELVEDEHTLYHWSRAMIAEETGDSTEGCMSSVRDDDALPVGLCLAYDGADYHERRVYSFSFVCADGKPVSENNGELLAQPDESEGGEFYVDSLAVIPEQRGKGIGKMMLCEALRRASMLGLTPSILVDPNNAPALNLYKSVGFVFEEEMRVFGENYHKYKVK